MTALLALGRWLLASPLGRAVGLVGLALAAVGGAFLKGRRAGRQIEKARAARAREKLQETYDEIDRRPRDFDDAVDRLRDRSRRR